MTQIATRLMELTRTCSSALSRLHFEPPVHATYNPLVYAAASYETYIRKFAAKTKRVLFLGMNPGPWGMAQTGVPFGEISAVRDWMGITADIKKPVNEHPKRQITGFDCTRSEVSGRRFWELMGERFSRAERFFDAHFVANYCPLIFLEESGRNRTPDKLKSSEREAIYSICDRMLVGTIELLKPAWLVGVGKFAEKRMIGIVEQTSVNPNRVLSIAHPSPANPAANRGWAALATGQLLDSAVWREEDFE